MTNQVTFTEARPYAGFDAVFDNSGEDKLLEIVRGIYEDLPFKLFIDTFSIRKYLNDSKGLWMMYCIPQVAIGPQDLDAFTTDSIKFFLDQSLSTTTDLSRPTVTGSVRLLEEQNSNTTGYGMRSFELRKFFAASDGLPYTFFFNPYYARQEGINNILVLEKGIPEGHLWQAFIAGYLHRDGNFVEPAKLLEMGDIKTAIEVYDLNPSTLKNTGQEVQLHPEGLESNPKPGILITCEYNQ
jgi:hypothetical protein